MKILSTAILGLVVLLGGCQGSQSPAAAQDDASLPGPHGGRLLRDGDFTLELALFEAGVAPEYRAWATQGGKPLAPSTVLLDVQLTRLGGVVERLSFTPQEDHLRSTGEVREPHSFVVVVQAAAGGASHRWEYESFEGRVTIPAAMAKEAGVVVETAGERSIEDLLPLYGVIAADPEAVRAVSARFPGSIRTIASSLGDTVKRGEVLATVESNESLQTYAVTAPIAGVITARHANPGEVAGEAPLFVITDLSRVTAELSLFPRDLARVRAGQRARIRPVDGGSGSEGRVIHVSPAGMGANQALTVRVRLDNADRRWTPGVYVNADLHVGARSAPVAVRADAVQRLRGAPVVFRNDGDTYEAQPVELGRGNGEWVEVTAGLPAGAAYVARNSFMVKADIEKSGAAHEH